MISGTAPTRAPARVALQKASVAFVAALVVSGIAVADAAAWIANGGTLGTNTRFFGALPSSRSPNGQMDRSFLLPSAARLSAAKNNQDMMDFINQPMGNSVGDDPPLVPPHQDELAPLVRCIAKAADSRKAEQIVALRVSPITTLTSFMVILSGNSRPQNQAIAAAVQEDVLEQFGFTPGPNNVPDGTADSGWMVLDYASVIVHVMTPKSRLYYNIEGQWRDKGGEQMDLQDVLVPNSPASVQTASSTSSSDEEDDPFWS